jgi:hypothetical protein
MLSQMNLGSTIQKEISNPANRSAMLNALQLPAGLQEAINGWFDKQGPQTKKQEGHSVEEWAKQFEALGVPSGQAYMGALAQTGVVPLQIAIWFNHKFPGLNFSPRIIKRILDDEIIPKITSLVEDFASKPAGETQTATPKESK